MWTGVDRVVLGVTELEGAAETYTSLLGADPAARLRCPQEGTESALFALANAALELRAPLPGRDADAAALLPGSEGVLEIAFGCDEVARAAAALAERGVSGALYDLELEDAAGEVLGVRELRLDRAATRGVRIVIREVSDGPSLRLQAASSDPVRGIDHVVIRTGDPEASIALYRDQLGVRLALDREFPERGVRLIFFRLGGVTLELAARRGGATGDKGDALWGVAYQVAEPRRARERVAAAGFDVSEVRPGNKRGTAVCTVRAPTRGVPTLLIGPESA